MIPVNREKLDAVAGEYVLGLLDSGASREIEAALVTNTELRDAVAFWEEKLHPLSALATAAEPPAGTWDAIANRLEGPSGRSAMPGWWKSAAPWRWSTAGFAAAAAALLFYVARAPAPVSPPLVALLHAPQQQAASWIATAGRDGLRLRAVANEVPPQARIYELWAIPPHATRPEPLGVVAANDTLRLARLPRAATEGATLAISIEPPGGSPTGLPTGPVVFLGALKAI